MTTVIQKPVGAVFLEPMLSGRVLLTIQDGRFYGRLELNRIEVLRLIEALTVELNEFRPNG